MSDIFDGGPAFPSQEIDLELGHYEGRYEVKAQLPGMSLRAWLAGKALSGLAAAHDRDGNWTSPCPETMALKCLEYADALLVQLELKAGAK